jgi:hypothetical protein
MSAKDLFLRVDQLLLNLQPAFHRKAAFRWFVLFVWAFLLRYHHRGVTSCLNALGLTEDAYSGALHFFRSSALDNAELARLWHEQVRAHPEAFRLHGRFVYVGDAINVPKDGRHMPAVKRLHQESENNDKPTWIRGHFFGAVGILVGKPGAMFHLPLRYQLHDGIVESDDNASIADSDDSTPVADSDDGAPDDGTPIADSKRTRLTIVSRMSALIRAVAIGPAYVILDAYYASRALLNECKAATIDVITRVRSTTVGHLPLPKPQEERGRGRPRKWGNRVKLSSLFAESDTFTQERLEFYEGPKNVRWRTIDLHWNSPKVLVRFVLVEVEGKGRVILISTDTTLTGPEIIQAYSRRFKIETQFRAMNQTMDGFGYHFWTKALDRQPKWRGDLNLSEFAKQRRDKIKATLAAYERFVTLNAIALGILQLISLEMSSAVWRHFPEWLRTMPLNGIASEQVVRCTLQSQAKGILLGEPDDLLLTKFRPQVGRRKPDPRVEKPSAA